MQIQITDNHPNANSPKHSPQLNKQHLKKRKNHKATISQSNHKTTSNKATNKQHQTITILNNLNTKSKHHPQPTQTYPTSSKSMHSKTQQTSATTTINTLTQTNHQNYSNKSYASQTTLLIQANQPSSTPTKQQVINNKTQPTKSKQLPNLNHHH